jgi:predicted nuclease of restriction endonuclease-like (RecB) superfamily
MDNRFNEIIKLIEESRSNAIRAVNRELINLYWLIGENVSNKIDSSEWGASVVTDLANHIKSIEPNLKGFSDKNIWRMKQFYETYRGDTKLSPAVREILDNEKNVFKDSYVFEFLSLPEYYNEADLQRGLLRQMKNFIVELGKDFVFIGEEFKLQVGASDFYIDLLFFHRGLQCLIAIELKADKFRPEHIGQLNFYLEALDREIKKPNENPSIGILLCKDKDNEVVEYSLSRNLSTTMVAEYKTQLPEKRILQNKLKEIFKNSETS